MEGVVVVMLLVLKGGVLCPARWRKLRHKSRRAGRRRAPLSPHAIASILWLRDMRTIQRVLLVCLLVARATFGGTRALVHSWRDRKRCELRYILDRTEIVHRLLREIGD
jgi:hypothetical protein